MALTFPSSPTIGQTYTLNGEIYQYDGKRWRTQISAIDTTGTLQNAGGDIYDDISVHGITQAQGFHWGVNTDDPYGNSAGYLGADAVNGYRCVVKTGNIVSSSTSTVSIPILDVYHDGHWGGTVHGEILLNTTYYGSGIKRYQFMGSRGGAFALTLMEEIGYETAPSLTSSTTLIGSATHSGQSVWKTRITLNNNGTYIQSHAIMKLGVFHNSLNAYDTDTAQAALESNRITQGGAVHFLQNNINGYPFKKVL